MYLLGGLKNGPCIYVLQVGTCNLQLATCKSGGRQGAN